MARADAVSASIRARIIHGALVFGVLAFAAVAYVTRERSIPAGALPDRRILYVALTLASAALFGAAAFRAGRLTAPAREVSKDDWWDANLGRVLVCWALVEAPTLLGLVVYTLTHDFRTLLAPFIGLLLFANYNPRRLTDR